jgi:hypothetical protein
MTTITRTFARYFALPIVSAGIIGRGPGYGRHGQRGHSDAADRPGLLVCPERQGHPAPEARPGWHGHHGVNHIEHLVPGYHR